MLLVILQVIDSQRHLYDKHEDSNKQRFVMNIECVYFIGCSLADNCLCIVLSEQLLDLIYITNVMTGL